MATMPFAGYFLARSLQPAFPAFLRTFSQFDSVWLRLSCDHGWIRSGSVNIKCEINNNNYNNKLGKFVSQGMCLVIPALVYS